MPLPRLFPVAKLQPYPPTLTPLERAANAEHMRLAGYDGPDYQ
jgi:hypothetical protein